jgi:sugar/nucleoside kinase (ribokinase family)
MNVQNPVICVGEVGIELARGGDGRFGLGFNGDTFNTAVYLARAGIPVAYATAMGDDPYSDGLVALATAEGVRCDCVIRVPGRLPGLTLVDTARTGERQFYPWGETSPARELFELPNWGLVAEGLVSARLIYFSGITLSLYSNLAIGRFLAALELARQRGVKVAFDGNFRPRGWKGNVARTRSVFVEALKRVDIALPTYEDEQCGRRFDRSAGARARPAACRADRHDRGGRRLQCRLSCRPPFRSNPRRRRGGRAPSCRRSDPAFRSPDAARRRSHALVAGRPKKTRVAVGQGISSLRTFSSTRPETPAEAGNCSTVAHCPGRSAFTSTTFPLANSSAS